MMRITERQAHALANMESYLGIRNQRTDFADSDEFQVYWSMIARRCDTTARIRSTETSADRAGKQQRQRERIVALYQNQKKLFEYGCEYVLRYQPSVAKVRNQLVAKSGNPELADTVMEKLAERMNDRIRAHEVAEIMQNQGRNAQEISGKLRQRLFSSEVIAQCLEQLTAANGSVLNAEAVERKIIKLQRKGVSQQSMRSKLMGQQADAPVIRAALHAALGVTGDEHALRLAVAKLARKNLDSRALIQRLVGKGFRYAEVVACLKNTSKIE